MIGYKAGDKDVEKWVRSRVRDALSCACVPKSTDWAWKANEIVDGLGLGRKERDYAAEEVRRWVRG